MMRVLFNCACLFVSAIKTSVALRPGQNPDADSMTPDVLLWEEASAYGFSRDPDKRSSLINGNPKSYVMPKLPLPLKRARYCLSSDKGRHTNFFSAQPNLHNQHMVFIGDSTMRQQYFNLASWLMLGKESDEEPANIATKERANYTQVWKRIFEHQTAQLTGDGGAHEICHCGRKGLTEELANNGNASFVEDRFAMLPNIGTNLSYFGWFGAMDFHGYFNTSNEHPTEASCPVGECQAPFEWTIKNDRFTNAEGVLELIERVVMKMSPAPTHVTINTGHWGSLTREGLESLFSLGQTIRRRTGTIFIWKTETKAALSFRNPKPEQYDLELKLASQYGWVVFDALNFTKHWDVTFYRNSLHALECKISLLNEGFVGDVLAVPGTNAQ